jgi:hypothetical protein
MKIQFKNLAISSLLLSLTQIYSAQAALAVSQTEHICQDNSIACKNLVTVLNSIDNNTHANNKETISASVLAFQLQTKKEIYAENTLPKANGNCDGATYQSLNRESNIGSTINTFGNTLFPLESLDGKFLSADKSNADYDIISQSDVQNCNVGEVPVPTAGWLFASALVAFITFSNRRRA